MSPDLRFAHKVVITNQQCQQSFESRFVPNSAICAIGFQNSRETAWSGVKCGPLVIQYNDTWMQIGIVGTFHPNGCTGTFPVVYTRMTSFIEWIYSNAGIPVDFWPYLW